MCNVKLFNGVKCDYFKIVFKYQGLKNKII